MANLMRATKFAMLDEALKYVAECWAQGDMSPITPWGDHIDVADEIIESANNWHITNSGLEPDWVKTFKADPTLVKAHNAVRLQMTFCHYYTNVYGGTEY